MSSASDLVEGRAWTAHTASVSRECFQYSSLSVLEHCFSSEFVRVRVFSDCCFSCLSLGTCDAHIFISSHDRSSTLCSAYTYVHRSKTCCLVGRIVPLLGSKRDCRFRFLWGARCCWRLGSSQSSSRPTRSSLRRRRAFCFDGWVRYSKKNTGCRHVVPLGQRRAVEALFVSRALDTLAEEGFLTIIREGGREDEEKNVGEEVRETCVRQRKR